MKILFLIFNANVVPNFMCLTKEKPLRKKANFQGMVTKFQPD